MSGERAWAMPINGDEICFALRREGAIYWREGRREWRDLREVAPRA